MIITANMNLTELAELMGDAATKNDSEAMRDMLMATGHENLSTDMLDDAEWIRLMKLAVSGFVS